MSSYNRINGTYACDNGALLRDVLRDDFGFDGVVFSDWFGTHSAAASLEAGMDLEMPGPPIERGDKLLAAVRDGEVAESRVDESVRRLLELFVWSQVGERDTTERTDDSAETRGVDPPDGRGGHGAAEERRRRPPARRRRAPRPDRAERRARADPGRRQRPGSPGTSVPAARRAARPAAST